MFSVADAFALADAVRSAPPARSHIVRPVPRGQLVARFALPLELCKPQNRTRHGQAWALGKLKSSVLLCMLSQHRRQSAPLAGRPQVICLRLSSVEPDRFADWAKHAVDRLCVANSGLGFLRDDRPSDADIHQYWEPAKSGHGAVIIEVRTG